MRELSLHILDIAQNSVTAGAKWVKIGVYEDTKSDNLTITIEDDGCGMPPEFLKKVTDPFTTKRTTRKVGLGIPLFKLAAENADGSFDISSELGKGTVVKATFVRSHIDRQPLGNLAETILGLVTAYENVDFLYTHQMDDKEFVFDTAAIKEVLDGVSLSTPDVYMWISEYIAEGENEVNLNSKMEG